MHRTILNVLEVLTVTKDVGEEGRKGAWSGQQDPQKGISGVSLGLCR